MNNNRLSLYDVLPPLIVLAILFLSPRAAYALDPGRALTQYMQTVWQTAQGLPQNTILSVVQGRDGYLWLGTQEGLVRFDGVQFRVYNRRNTPAIRNNMVQALCEDAEGNVWFGTDEGLVKLKDGEFTRYTLADGLSSDMVTALAADRSGNVWVGTRGGGLNRFRDGKFTAFTTGNGLSNDKVFSIFEDRHGALWIGTGGGLNRMENFAFTDYPAKSDFSQDVVLSIAEDREGALWIGTRKSGLKRLKEGTLAAYTTADGLPNNFVLKVYKDRDENIWVGTYGGGLSRMQNGKFATLPVREELPASVIISITEDREGNLWVGTESAGLIRLSNGKFTTYTTAEGLSDNQAWAVYEDRQGALWVGTDNGLSHLADNRFTTFTTKDGLAQNIAWAIGEDNSGDLWVGTRGGGVSRMRGGRFTNYTTKDGLPDDLVRAFHADADGALWIGTANGLGKFKDDRFSVYRTEQGLSNNNIFALGGDREGGVWIGTQGGGLNLYRNGVFTAYTTQQGLASNIVYAVYEDQAGVLWVGTDAGLSRVERVAGDGGREVKITSYTTRDGLFDDIALSIMEDANGNLWMSCLKGVYRISRRELDDFAAGKSASVVSKAFGIADGMKSSECNGGSQPAGWKSRDGRLWFTTTKGIAVIDPASIRQNSPPPPVFLQDVTADGTVLDGKRQISLAAGTGNLQLDYTAPSLSAPEKVRFRYKLEGIDKGWIDAGSRRTAYYTNLPPGNHSFRVIAANDDGVWNEQGASLSFYLRPRFHQTTWFMVLCVAAGVGIILGLQWLWLRVRFQQMQARHHAVLAERSRLAREIHDTLTQGFVGISSQLDAVATMLAKTPEVAIRHLELARRMARHNLTEARRSVSDLRDLALEENDLPQALSKIADYAAGSGTEISVEVDGTPRQLPAETEQNILRIAQEAVTNSIKHARAGLIEIRLVYEPSRLRLKVTDDGRGFEEHSAFSTLGGHFGMLGMRERAERLGGEFVVSSNLGGGTKITVTVPVT